MNLIVISSSVSIQNEEKLLSQLFENGLTILHLRKPGMVCDEMRAYIKKIPAEFHDRIMLHSNYELLNDFNLRGIHFTEETRKADVIVFNTRSGHLRSTSFHELGKLEMCKINYDYVFYSPVFESISKPGYHNSSIDLDVMKKSLNLCAQNVVALGGVTPKTIPALIGSGFWGIATLGYIWQSAKPLDTFIEMKNTVDDFSKSK